jgi:hypothetical protein
MGEKKVAYRIFMKSLKKTTWETLGVDGSGNIEIDLG